MLPLASVFSTLTQGSGLLGGGGGSEPSSASATSGISGPVSFDRGDLNINKTNPVLIYVIAGIAGFVLLVYIKKKK